MAENGSHPTGDILDAIVALLNAERQAGGEGEPDGTLIDVRSVIRGDRTDHTPATPAIWVFPERAETTQHTGLAEIWHMRVFLTVIVQMVNPDNDLARCEELAWKATDAVIAQRRLNLPSTVYDVYRERLYYAPRIPAERQHLYGIAAGLLVRFRLVQES